MKKAMLLLLGLLPAALGAVTLGEARELATERYPLMKDYNLLSLTEQYTVENAAKAWLPQVGASAQASWQTAVAAYPQVLTDMLEQRGLHMKGLGKFQYKAQVEVTQTIWDGGRIKAQQAAARADAAQSKASNDVELYHLRERIDGLFFGIILLEQQEMAISASAELLKANLAKANSLVANGAAMQSDADAIHAELLTTLQQLESVKASSEAYRSILALYIGPRADEPLDTPEEIAEPQASDFSSRPEIALFGARAAMLKTQLLQIKASTMPQVGAFAQGFYGYPGLNFMEAMMSRKPGFDTLLGIKASWPINSFYTKKGKTASVMAAIDRISVAEETFLFNSSVQASQQRSEIARLRKISESDSEIIALRQRVRAASEAKLREGVVEPTDLLLRITEEKNAIIAANTRRIEYLKALYSLQTITGTDFQK